MTPSRVRNVPTTTFIAIPSFRQVAMTFTLYLGVERGEAESTVALKDSKATCDPAELSESLPVLLHGSPVLGSASGATDDLNRSPKRPPHRL